MEHIYTLIVLAPLIGSLMAGLFGKSIGKRGAHVVTIAGICISTVLSIYVFYRVAFRHMPAHEVTLYSWAMIDGLDLQIGFLIDRLTAVMMVVVTFVSLMVHIYTIGYMRDDPGYQRFFAYISAFTFAMLMLCMSNNFLQLFFGWEGVGLMSYLLIGFWHDRDSAINANLKAFLVNRVGDFGFLLGIGAVLMYFGSLQYSAVFDSVGIVRDVTVQVFPGTQWSVITLICLLLFIGAMGKSAQIPLHVWLPDSMEGPTPISALIHAATMVTAGVFMVARMSPLFEFSDVALSFVLIIGATTALFMGLVGLVQNDIKRIVAYSTLSQLGYMMVANGASAYEAGVFHLGTHAFFKALLFLAAGSVIIAMHHDQDIRKMGGLRKYLPITWMTSLVGSLALIGFPGFSGFFSKDAIIEAVRHSSVGGSGYAYFCVLVGVFVTALYTFRMYFLVFHGKERMDENTRSHLHEPVWVVTLPLILLAIPSVIIGGLVVESALFGGLFGDTIFRDGRHVGLTIFEESFSGAGGMVAHSIYTPPFWLALAGVAVAWCLYMGRPELPALIKKKALPAFKMLEAKYWFDEFNTYVFAGGARRLGGFFWQFGDVKVIDGFLVNGSARLVGLLSSMVRHLQSGLLYRYAFAMILGLLAVLTWLGPLFR